MSLTHRCVLLAALLFIVLPPDSFAAGGSHAMLTPAEKSLRGTWYSPKGSITFKSNGTTYIKGKRYYYAVSNGGLIQLSGKHRMNAIPYQLAGSKLTLTVDGEETVYFRKRPRRK